MIDSKFKSGFVTIAGKPNVGKSTLMNCLMGEKLSIITPKPQTTRHQIKGILSSDDCQIIFLDTPGFLEPRYELQKKMLEYIMLSLKDADLIIFITDADNFPTDYDQKIIQLLNKIKAPKIAILNKVDLTDPDSCKDHIAVLENKDFDQVLPLSLTNEPDVAHILKMIKNYLPYNPPYYDPNELSDLPMRFFAQEVIREQIFLKYRDEIPYSSTVVVENYKDFPNKIVISANIWLEKRSQKIILIGKKGEKIKALRQAAEKEIYKITAKRIKLELWIKIKQHWRKKKNALKEFGYS